MIFINKAKNKLLSTFHKFSAFKRLFPKKLKAVLSAFRNLQPTTYNLQPSFYNLKPVRGFTLIETLVAISILMVAVASPLTIAQKGLASAIYAKDQIIASYLAQDAIEYILNKSANNISGGSGWLDGIVGGTAVCETACKVDTSAGSISSCDGACPALNYNSSTHVYSYSGGGSSPFTRTIEVAENPSNEALITVTMSWTDKGATRTLKFYARIYNWR